MRSVLLRPNAEFRVVCLGPPFPFWLDPVGPYLFPSFPTANGAVRYHALDATSRTEVMLMTEHRRLCLERDTAP